MDLITVLQFGLAIISLVLPTLAALAQIILYFANRKPVPTEAPPGAGRREEARIMDATRELHRQETANRWNRWISGGLTAGQYLVGAALASVFIRQTMPEYAVGILGLIVVFSQVVQQRFRPDLRAIGANERSTVLRRLIREAEDQLYALETKQDGAPSLYDIRAMVARGLAQVERLESEELTLRMRAQLEVAEVQRPA